MGQVRNRKAARYGKLPSIWKRSAIAIGVAAVLACVGLPAYAQKVECDERVPTTGVVGNDAISCGARAQTAANSVAVGYETAAAARAVAIGSSAKALATDSLALGAGALVDATATDSIALGAGSHATGTSAVANPYLSEVTKAQLVLKELAIGGRRISGVADGANNDDAATIGQLKAANVGNDLAVRYDWNDANRNGIVDPGEVLYDHVTMGMNPKDGSKVATTITNVAAGKADSDVVNVSQLKGVTGILGGGAAVNPDGSIQAPNFNVGNMTNITTVSRAVDELDDRIDGVLASQISFGANEGAIVGRKLGETLNIKGVASTSGDYSGDNIKTVTDPLDGTINVELADSPKFGDVTINAAGGGTITGVTDGQLESAGKEAVNGGQLYTTNMQVAKQGADTAAMLGGSATYTAATGAIAAPSYELTNANTIGGGSGAAADVGAGFNKVDAALGKLNEGFNISADGGVTVEKITHGETVKFAAGTNATVSRTGDIITYGVVDAPAFAGMITANGGLTVGAGKTVNMGGNRVTNVDDGTDDNDAVNFSQLTAAAAAAGSWKLQANNGPADTITAVDTVSVVNGVNTAVSYDGTTNELKVDVVDAPTFAGMVTANGGLTVGAGQTVDMGGNAITNVAAGSAADEAVNVAQLTAVTTALGGGAAVNGDGTITAPSYKLDNANEIVGTTGAATNVGEGFDKVDAALGTLDASITNITNGNAGINYFHVNSTDVDSSATGHEAIAIGPRAQGNGWFGVAMGSDARAIGDASTAIGSGAWAYGYESTAVGFYAEARGNLSAAFGSALAFGEGTTALGTWAYAGGGFDWTGAGGRPGNIVEIKNGTAVGFSSVAAADNATALGAEAEARGEGSLAMGSAAQATGIASIAAGEGAMAVADNSVALGAGAVASDVVGTASTEINGEIYNFAGTAPTGTVSVGSPGSERTITNLAAGRIEAASTDAVNGSQLYATNQAIETISGVAGNANDLAVKYGWNDANGDGIATQDEIDYSTVTLDGSKGTTIDNVAPAFLDPGSMQAVNGAQLFQSMDQVAMMLGGGAAMTANGLTAPSYFIQGSVYNDVGSALQALDISISTLDGRPVGSQLVGYTHGHDSNPYGDGGPGSTALGVGATALGAEESVALGESATVAADYGTAVGQEATVTADNAVALGHGSVADRANTVSVGSAGSERQVTNVADATQGTDAINKRQLDRGVASANSYTDARVNALSDNFDQFQGAVDERLRKQDDRIDRQGAMSAAMMNMAVSAAGLHTPNRFGVGVGFQGGESALSLGYQRAFSDRATLTFGGAVSSDDTSVGVGAGFGW